MRRRQLTSIKEKMFLLEFELSLIANTAVCGSIAYRVAHRSPTSCLTFCHYCVYDDN